MQEIILTISLLVSNRIDTIRKCMESIRPILEQLPSELIAIDTVGKDTDGSIDIVREYTDKIYPFTWCNDFSAARNAGLKRAKGRWFMFMDDDEWFEDVQEIVDFFRSGEYKHYKSAAYRIHDYSNRQGAYLVGTLSRMVQLEKNTKFCGVVHEYLDPMYFPCKEFTCYIHHYGYVFDTQEEHEKHSERNLSLLRPEFEKNPNNLRLRLQMVQECMYLKKLEQEALRLCEETMQFDKMMQIQPAFQWIITSYVRLADRNKEWSIVLERAEKIRKQLLINSFTNVALSIMELEACKQLEQIQLVKERLQTLEKSYRFLKENPKKRQEQNTCDFEIFLEPSIIAKALSNGICMLHQFGEKKEAMEWTKKRKQFLSCPPLSISLLVSNHISTIQKCMESIQRLQKELGAEIIVVDTVGEKDSDGSLAIAKKYADKVIPFEWCDDFSAARNAGLVQTTGEWFLYIDDDEWFEDVQEIVEFFLTGEYLCYYSATYQIRNYKDKIGENYSTSVLPRMIRRTSSIKFIGSVHETFSELLLPCKEFSSYVHHFGYAYANEAEKLAHFHRNLTLLKKDLEKNPTNLRCRVQVATELAMYDNKEALTFCEETFQVCSEQKQEVEFQWLLSFVFRLYESAEVEAEFAEKSYIRLKKLFGFSDIIENVICYHMVRICLIKNVPERAYPYAVTYFKTFQMLKQNKELQQNQILYDLQKYQTEENYLELLYFGGYSAYRAKAYEDAWHWYGQLPWESEQFQKEDAFWIVLEIHCCCPNVKALLDIIKRVMKNAFLIQRDGIGKQIAEVLKDLKNKTVVEETMKPKYIKSDIKLTIGVLVSNSIETIRKCMDSLTPIRKAIKSELIVVDTKGEASDGSIEIAKEYADKVYSFAWCNDFSAARNVCIEHAEGEWFLFVDDDEWFEDVQEIIEFFQSGECDAYGQGVYHIRNYSADGSYTIALVSRLFHRTKDTRFVGKIHETMEHVYLPKKKFSIYANHSGYAFKTEKDRLKKNYRNISLLEKEIEEQGLNSVRAAQMVQELLSNKKTIDKGYQYCMKYISELETTEQLLKPSGQWLLVSSARYFAIIGKFEQLVEQVEWIRSKYVLSEIAQVVLAVTIIFPAVQNDRMDLVANYTEIYFKNWDWMKEHEEEALMQLQLDFSGFCTEEQYEKIVCIAAITANYRKNYRLANAYWKRLPWDKEGFDGSRYAEDLQITINGLQNIQKWNQLEDLLNMLIEAEHILETKIQSNSFNELEQKERIELLQCMQEAAITIGTTVDELVGEGTELVNLLSTFCEVVWNCSQVTSNNELENCVGDLKVLLDKVQCVFEKTKQDNM